MIKDKIKKYAKEAVLFLLFMTLFANGVSFYRSYDLHKTPLDSESISLLEKSFSKDEPVLIYFWATWCPVCKMQTSNIEAVSKKFKVITVAVKSGDDAKIAEYTKSNDLSFMVLNDPDGFIAKKLNISVFPTTVIYDRKGEIFFSDVGYTTTFGLMLRVWLASL